MSEGNLFVKTLCELTHTVKGGTGLSNWFVQNSERTTPWLLSRNVGIT